MRRLPFALAVTMTSLAVAPARAATIVVSTSIQAAVDAAAPGDRIVVPRGTYRENVTVSKNRISILGQRGAVLDGSGLPGNTGITVVAGTSGTMLKGFYLRGLTIRNYAENGIRLVRVDGFEVLRGRYEDNEEYGIFPVFSLHGRIAQDIVTGAHDAGIYVGQSSDIDVVDNNVFGNTSGIEVENSSRVRVRHNVAHENAIGIAVFVLPGLAVTATDRVEISANLIASNNAPNPVTDPTEVLSLAPAGSGLLIVAADELTVRQNLVLDNRTAGIGQVRLPPAIAALDPRVDPLPDHNRYVANVGRDNGSDPDTARSPYPGADFIWDVTGVDNCGSRNSFGSTFPAPLPACP